MTNFHEYYSELLKKLPLSIKKNIWNRLISRLHNSLSEKQASSIHPDIEVLLINDTTFTNIQVNARIKEATDNLRQEFIKSTEETLKTIKQQKDIECNQIKIDMANWSTKLFELSLKKYIRDGTIYNFIHALEEKD
ncbi:6693_t:CDS:2, partial [Scutellospora calospora]